MKRFYFNSKIAVIAALLAITFFAAAHEANSALVDWEKHEEWRRKQLQALVDEVKLKWEVPYFIMSFRNYDTNADGVIDRDEVEAIKDFLKTPRATRPKK